MYCLWCHEEIITEVHWGNLIHLYRPKRLCMNCESQLIKIQGHLCSICSRVSSVKKCVDCLKWEDYEESPIKFNASLYTYNSFMQEVVAKWKYRGDYQLAKIFQYEFEKEYSKKFSFLTKKKPVVVPIPLSKQRMSERGFNQAEVLADFIPLQKDHVLERLHGEKQAKKTRYERISTENPFILRKSINKTVLLVDDIYTTGTTLRHAARLLKGNGCPNVYTYTLIRG
ncbi:ComF family protein [Virgibacillus halodenitrificans]|nr:ComF family protein [Virgibacillus halodenitrificans]